MGRHYTQSGGACHYVSVNETSVNLSRSFTEITLRLLLLRISRRCEDLGNEWL